MSRNFLPVLGVAVAAFAHAQEPPESPKPTGITLVHSTTPVPFTLEYPTPPLRTAQANQTVTVSGTFSLQHSLTGSTNVDAPWSFPYNQLGSPNVGWDNVQYSISATILTANTYYWAKLDTQCWDGDEIFDLTYSSSPMPLRVAHHALWYDKGSNMVGLVVLP